MRLWERLLGERRLVGGPEAVGMKWRGQAGVGPRAGGRDYHVVFTRDHCSRVRFVDLV